MAETLKEIRQGLKANKKNIAARHDVAVKVIDHCGYEVMVVREIGQVSL